MSRALTTHDCRNGHHGRLCGMTPCDCVCHANERPAAPAAETDLREQIRQELDDSVLMHTGRSVGDLASDRVAGDLLALPALQRLVEQAAEAAQLRKTVERVRSMRDVATAGTVTTAALDWALDGTDG